MFFPKSIIFLFIVVLSALSFLRGQEVKQEERYMHIQGNKYHVNFEYYLSKNDTIFHGPITINQPIEVNKESALFNSFSVHGQYKENKKDSTWIIKKGHFQPVGGGIFQDYNYSFKVDGIESVAHLNYKNDQQIKHWKLLDWSIKNSIVADTFFSSELLYGTDSSNGVLYIKSESYHLQGYLDNTNYTTGTWSYYKVLENGDRQLLHEWVFQDNVLVNTTYHRDGKAETLHLDQERITDYVIEDLLISDAYLKIVHLIAKVNHPDSYQKYLNAPILDSLLLQTVKKYHEKDNSLFFLLQKTISPEIKTRVLKFPYSENELNLIGHIRENINEIDSLISNLQNDPQINLAKISTEQVTYFTAVLSAINNQKILPIRDLLLMYDSGKLEYINRNKIINKLIHFDNQIVVDTVGPSNELISGIYAIKTTKSTDEVGEDINGLNDFTKAIISEIENIRDSLDYYIYEIKKEENLVALETALIEKYSSLKLMIDSLIGDDLNRIAGINVAGELITFLDNEISNYSKLGSIEEKVNKIGPLIDCFKGVEQLISTLEFVPVNVATIQEAYTRQVFNPYTFTNMEETIKPAIYKAFHELILPDMFNQLQNLNCNTVNKSSKNFNNIFEGMIDLLKRDTRSEERRLRRVDDPKRAAEVLNLNLFFN